MSIFSTSSYSRQIIPYIDAIDQIALKLQHNPEDMINPRIWRQYGAKFGLTKLDLPSHICNGLGLSLRDLLSIYEYAGRISLNLRDVIGIGHAYPLLMCLSNEQLIIQKSQKNYIMNVLQDISDGIAYVAILITEPSMGSDLHSMKSYSRTIYDENKNVCGYRLYGVKCFNARIEQCTHMLIMVRNEQNLELNTFLCETKYFINHSHSNVKHNNDTDNDNIKNNHDFDTTTTFSLGAAGLEGNSFGGCCFNGIFLPCEALIGGSGNGYEIFHKHFARWRLLQSASCLGTAIGGLLEISNWVRERQLFMK